MIAIRPIAIAVHASGSGGNAACRWSTQPRSPTTTGKIEPFYHSLRAEFLSEQVVFSSLKAAQQALDQWVDYYDTARPHQSLKMDTPAQRFAAGGPTHA